jgi:AraC-like DNA-binding protein/quercetin dioxygenase-like cupin family protein
MAEIPMMHVDPLPHGAAVNLVRMRRHRERPMHQHPCVELVVVLSGRGTHFTENESWPIAAGDAFVIAHGGGHGYRDVHDLHLVNVLYLAERVALPEAELRQLPGYHLLYGVEPALRREHRFRGRLRLGARDLAAVSAILDELEAELTRRQHGFRAMASALLVRLVCRLARSESSSRTVEGMSAQRLADLIAFVEAHHTQTLNLRGLAARAHLPVNTLLRHFRSATGTTPIDYAIHRRIESARELLRHSDRSVTDIALAVGFSDSNYFARRFRADTGMTPSAYRGLTGSGGR